MCARVLSLTRVASRFRIAAYGSVDTYCSCAPLAACFPDTPLRDILPRFEEFTGLPVLDLDGKPVGVVSEKDVTAYLGQYGDDTSRLATPVKCVRSCGELHGIVHATTDALLTRRFCVCRQVMSAPAVCIRHDARVAYAAGLMLQHRVHRLPVVDASGRCVSIITRADVFKPLIPDALADPLYLQKVRCRPAPAWEGRDVPAWQGRDLPAL